jgi:hypothetical protein
MQRNVLKLLLISHIVVFRLTEISAQKFLVKFISNDSITANSKFFKPKELKNKEQFSPFLRDYRFNLIDQGYFLAQTNVQVQTENGAEVVVNLDKNFNRIQLYLTKEQKLIIKKSDANFKIKGDVLKLKPSEISLLLSKLLNYYLNNGYPYLAWQGGNSSYTWLIPTNISI